MIENFTIGITSGLVVTLFVVVFRNFWINVITPWIEDRVYKDAKIEGKWFVLAPNQDDLKQDVVTLKRHGHEVHGKLICTKGADEGEEYTLKGSFRNLILTLSYESANESQTDRGTFTLQCIRNAERFSGYLASYNTYRDRIEPVSMVWFRSKDDLEKFISKIIDRKDEIRQLELSRKEILQKEKEIEDSNDENNDE